MEHSKELVPTLRQAIEYASLAASTSTDSLDDDMDALELYTALAEFLEQFKQKAKTDGLDQARVIYLLKSCSLGIAALPEVVRGHESQLGEARQALHDMRMKQAHLKDAMKRLETTLKAKSLETQELEYRLLTESQAKDTVLSELKLAKAQERTLRNKLDQAQAEAKDLHARLALAVKDNAQLQAQLQAQPESADECSPSPALLQPVPRADEQMRGLLETRTKQVEELEETVVRLSTLFERSQAELEQVRRLNQNLQRTVSWSKNVIKAYAEMPQAEIQLAPPMPELFKEPDEQPGNLLEELAMADSHYQEENQQEPRVRSLLDCARDPSCCHVF